MTTHKPGDKIMFSTPKGVVKVGIVTDVKSVLHQDEYEDVYTIELESGKIHYVDASHVISKVSE